MMFHLSDPVLVSARQSRRLLPGGSRQQRLLLHTHKAEVSDLSKVLINNGLNDSSIHSSMLHIDHVETHALVLFHYSTTMLRQNDLFCPICQPSLLAKCTCWSSRCLLAEDPGGIWTFQSE
jgi:hypothetical protein